MRTTSFGVVIDVRTSKIHSEGLEGGGYLDS